MGGGGRRGTRHSGQQCFKYETEARYHFTVGQNWVMAQARGEAAVAAAVGGLKEEFLKLLINFFSISVGCWVSESPHPR